MKYLERAYNLEKLVKPGQVLVLYGPRRAGKTTLVKKYTETLTVPYLSESGDNIIVQEIFNSLDSSKILNRVAGLKVYIIDEAQNITNIGRRGVRRRTKGLGTLHST